MMTRAEFGVSTSSGTLRAASAHQELKGARMHPSLSLQRERGPANTLNSGFWAPEL